MAQCILKKLSKQQEVQGKREMFVDSLLISFD